MMLRDTSELRQTLAVKAITVLEAVYMSVADHVHLIERYRQISVTSVVLINVIVDCVVISAENHCLTSRSVIFSSTSLEILPNRLRTGESDEVSFTTAIKFQGVVSVGFAAMNRLQSLTQRSLCVYCRLCWCDSRRAH